MAGHAPQSDRPATIARLVEETAGRAATLRAVTPLPGDSSALRKAQRNRAPDIASMKRARVAHRTVMRHCGAPIRHRDHATPRNRGGPPHEPSETEFEGHAAFLASAESVRAAGVAALVAGRQECADHHW